MQMPSFARELEGLRDTLKGREEKKKTRKNQVEDGGEECTAQDAKERGEGPEGENQIEQVVEEVPKGLEAWKEYKRRNAEKEKQEEWEDWLEPSSNDP